MSRYRPVIRGSSSEASPLPAVAGNTPKTVRRLSDGAEGIVMSEILVWLHPLMQVIAALIGLWAMWQGWKRFAMTHGRKVMFPWKQHVRWGTVALVLWTLGALGFYVTHSLFGSTHVTGLHAELAWVVVGLSLFGLATGFIMDRNKKRRKWLPLIHGGANVVLLVLVLMECYTGYGLLETFLPL